MEHGENFMAPFYGWFTTVYFLPLSPTSSWLKKAELGRTGGVDILFSEERQRRIQNLD